MAGPAPIFREIHRLRRFSRDLQEQLERIPRQLKIHQTRLAKQEQALRDAQDGVKRLKVAASEKEKAFKSRYESIERFQKQINDVSSKKEYDALQLEIAHAKTDCAKLEDDILTALSESEEVAARIPDVEKAVKSAKDELKKYETETGPRKADLEAQLKEAQQQLKVVEETIPADVQPYYNRAVASHGADSMAVVRDRVCESCYTEITAQSQNELAQEQFVQCRSCGRILYLPESTAKAGEFEDEE